MQVIDLSRWIGLLALLVIVIACAETPGVEVQETANVEEIVNSADSTFEKQDPFSLRPVSFERDGTWIGKAISYGCYRDGQAPGVSGPSEAEILEDLNILKEHWNLVRVYGSDDDAARVLKVIRDNDLPVQVMLGIWLQNEILLPENRPENIEQVTRGIELANQYPEQVFAINVGNETQVWWSAHRISPTTLTKYIRLVRSMTEQPVTTADDYNFWNKTESQAIAKEIDFIVFHAYALWNGQQLDHAISWTDSVYRDLKVRHSDKILVLGETGWATTYNPEKTGPGEQGSLIKAEVGYAAQERFLTEIDAWIRDSAVPTFLFEAFDEKWKGGGADTGPTEVEKHWGLYNSDRSPKPSFVQYLEKQDP